MSDDDDEIDMDEWMAMSDAEIERECDIAMREYNEWWDSLSIAEQIAISRRRAVEQCLKWRKLIRENDWDFMREDLRRTQVRLLKIREWRRTGQFPASA